MGTVLLTQICVMGTVLLTDLCQESRPHGTSTLVLWNNGLDEHAPVSREKGASEPCRATLTARTAEGKTEVDVRSICPECGTASDPTARSRFCLNCGADLMIPPETVTPDEAEPDEPASTGPGSLVKRIAAAAVAFVLAFGVGYAASGGFGAKADPSTSSDGASTTNVTSTADTENASSDASASDSASANSEEAVESPSQSTSGDEKLKFANDLHNKSAKDLAELREYASLIGREFALPFTMSDLVNMSPSEIASATSGLYEEVADSTTSATRYIYSTTQELYKSMSSMHLYEMRKTGGVPDAPWWMQIGNGNGSRWGEIRRNDIAAGTPFAVSFRGNVPIEEPTYNDLCESVAQVFDYNAIIIYDFPSSPKDLVTGFAMTDNAYADIHIYLCGGYFQLDIDTFNPEWDDDDRSPQKIFEYYENTSIVDVLYEHKR